MMPRRLVFTSILALSCALILLAAPLRAADNEQLQKRFQEANAKLDAGEVQPALEIYNSILEAEPAAGNVWTMRAIAKWKLKDLSGARADLAQALALHPDNVDAYRVRGQLRYESQDYSNSLADFSQAIELVEAAPRAEQSRGGTSDHEHARALAQESAELYGMRGEVEKQRGDSTAAIRDLTRALELNPDYLAARFLRAQLYEAEQRATEADEDYTKVIELKPTHADALNNRAWIRLHDRKWEDAIADGKKALEVAPKSPVAMRVVGYAQFALGDFAEAAKLLAASADVDPSADSAYALFVRHFALSRTGGADERLATASGNWTNEPWLHALAQFITGRIDEDALEKVAKDTPDDGELLGRACEMHFYIGLARQQAGDRSTARLRFQSALKTEQTTFVEDALSAAELARL